MAPIALTSIVIDMAIYPRAEVADGTVTRYAEAITAGETLPAIVLETGTHRLLDGLHRYRAHQKLDLTEIDAEHHEIPDGTPPKAYAASLSVRHGDRIKGEELKLVAREVIAQNPGFSHKTLARLFAVSNQTVGRWVGDITERQTMVRRIRVLLLTKAGGRTQDEIAKLLGIHQTTVMRDFQMEILHNDLTEDLLREALVGLPPECERAAEEIREEQIFAHWSDDERDLLKQLRAGTTVVVSMRGAHANLIEWATSADLYVRVDRRTEWGNPFETPADGDRDTVIRNYAEHYLPHKPSLQDKIATLQGKALGCWCAPLGCHADVLKEEVEL